MAEEQQGDKTEAATPRRRQEAREQGNVARSHDVTVALILIGMMVLLHVSGPKLVDALKGFVHQMLGPASFSNLNASRAGGGILDGIYAVAIAMTPLLAGVVLIAIVGNVAQVGFNFAPIRLQPNLGALNPLRGFGRIFGSRNPTQLLLSILKMIVIGMVAYSAIHSHIMQIMAVQNLSFMQIFALGASTVYSIGLRVGVVMFILAIGDYIYQRWRLEQDLKMTKQEVKDEMRRMDGDPKIKQRRRQIAVQQYKKRLAKEVPTADVVVTNPTEFAVALKYDKEKMHAPRVIAKGQGYIAQQIRQIAIAAGVPILERKPLARALYKMVEVGQEIPEQFYSAVAEIIAYVYELTRRAEPRVRPFAS